MHKLINKQKEKTIRNNLTYGPAFGGADLYISDQSNINKSHADIGYSYCNDAYYPVDKLSSW